MRIPPISRTSPPVVCCDFTARDSRDVGNALGFEFVCMNRGGAAIQETCQSWNGLPEQASADVILVVMSDQGAYDLHVVTFGLLEQRLHIPRRVHHNGFSCFVASDQVGEVGHFADGNLAKIKVALHGDPRLLSCQLSRLYSRTWILPSWTRVA